jgi:hypothetical protein
VTDGRLPASSHSNSSGGKRRPASSYSNSSGGKRGPSASQRQRQRPPMDAYGTQQNHDNHAPRPRQSSIRPVSSADSIITPIQAPQYHPATSGSLGSYEGQQGQVRNRGGARDFAPPSRSYSFSRGGGQPVNKRMRTNESMSPSSAFAYNSGSQSGQYPSRFGHR